MKPISMIVRHLFGWLVCSVIAICFIIVVWIVGFMLFGSVWEEPSKINILGGEIIAWLLFWPLFLIQEITKCFGVHMSDNSGLLVIPMSWGGIFYMGFLAIQKSLKMSSHLRS